MRSFSMLSLAVLAAIGVGIGALAASGAVGSAGVIPEGPHALAVAPGGDLYVVDSLRDQILRWNPGGSFQVVAGSGKRGFSGDGGPAVDAAIHLDADAGIAIARNGTVVFSDSSNSRIREVLPNGVIETVAGGGSILLGTRSVPALRADLGPNLSDPAGLAIGPDGLLYMGLNNGVYRLSSTGLLQWIVGERVKLSSLPTNWRGVYSNPAIQNDFQPAVRLAFDRSGDLFVAGGGGWGLYEMRRNGALRFVGVDRQPGGFWGSIAESPGGSVVTADPYIDGMVGASSLSTPELISALGRALGRLPQPLPTGDEYYTFIPENAAFDAAGDLYVDSISGAALPTLPAIAMVTPSGRVTMLWKAS